MAFEKFPNQTGQNWPVSTQYQTLPAAAVGVPASPQYGTFPESGSVGTPATILGANLLAWWRADLGAAANQWDDQSGNGHHLSEATNPPTLGAASGPNGTPAYTFDGTNDIFVAATLNLPAPGTTPTWYWLIFRQVTWTSGDGIICPTASRCEIRQSGASPAIIQIGPNVVSSNTAAVLGTNVRLESLFSNSASDYIKIIGTTTGGSTAGNNDPTGGITLGARAGGTNFSNIVVAELAIANVDPSAGQKSALDSYCTSRYGAGLV